MKTPDEEVASRIVEKLRQQGVLSDSALTKLEANIVAGKMSAEDWKLTFEIDRPEKSRTADNENK